MYRNRFRETAIHRLQLQTGVWLRNDKAPFAVKRRSTSLYAAALWFLALLSLTLWTSTAFAYSTWSGGCQTCHGGFNGANYSSLTADDPASWGQNLMNGHISQFGLTCSDCHNSSGLASVTLNASTSGVTCSSCHGRAEDDAGLSLGGSLPSAGLRQHHYNAGVTTCSSCHAADSNPANFTPVGENVAPQTFIAKNIDPCNDQALGAAGLDNDGDGPRDSADTDCQVAVNLPPTAVISAPTTGVEGTVITFDGSGFSDPDGTIVAYDWNLGDGTAASGQTVTHSFAAGSYTVTLTVTDDAGATTSTSSNITITPAAQPQPAVAVISGPSTATEGTPVSFDGSASSDPDGTIVAYDWNLGDGTAATGSNVTHSYAAGNYTVTLTVTDDSGLTNSTSQSLSVSALPQPLPPVADAGGPYSANEGEIIQFDGSASTDPDGSITTYAWDFGDGAIGSGVGPVHSYATAGSYNVSLTVTDNDGLTATAQTTATISPVTPTPTPDGGALYSQNCSGCHGVDGQGGSTGVAVVNATASQIQNAIDTNRGGMGQFAFLTAPEVQAISDFLASVVPTPTPTPDTGEGLYMTHCAACHGAGGEGGPYGSVQGESAGDIREAIAEEPMMGFLADVLSTEDISRIAEFLNSSNSDEESDGDGDGDRDDEEHHNMERKSNDGGKGERSRRSRRHD